MLGLRRSYLALFGLNAVHAVFAAIGHEVVKLKMR